MVNLGTQNFATSRASVESDVRCNRWGAQPSLDVACGATEPLSTQLKHSRFLRVAVARDRLPQGLSGQQHACCKPSSQDIIRRSKRHLATRAPEFGLNVRMPAEETRKKNKGLCVPRHRHGLQVKLPRPLVSSCFSSRPIQA